MKNKIIFFGIFFLWILPPVLFGEKAIVLEQEGAPIKITEYKVTYLIKEIIHSIKYMNISGKKIVAVKFGFLTFNVFNEFLDKFSGFTLEDVDIQKEKKGSWTHSPYAAFSFEKYGTGIAYVDTVRYEDGTLWKVKKEDILPQIQEIQKSFSVELLEEKKEK